MIRKPDGPPRRARLADLWLRKGWRKAVVGSTAAEPILSFPEQAGIAELELGITAAAVPERPGAEDVAMHEFTADRISVRIRRDAVHVHVVVRVGDLVETKVGQRLQAGQPGDQVTKQPWMRSALLKSSQRSLVNHRNRLLCNKLTGLQLDRKASFDSAHDEHGGEQDHEQDGPGDVRQRTFEHLSLTVRVFGHGSDRSSHVAA